MSEDRRPPLTIYLQCMDDNGEYAGRVAGAEITWCENQIEENDEQYVRRDIFNRLLVSLVEIAGYTNSSEGDESTTEELFGLSVEEVIEMAHDEMINVARLAVNDARAAGFEL